MGGCTWEPVTTKLGNCFTPASDMWLTDGRAPSRLARPARRDRWRDFGLIAARFRVLATVPAACWESKPDRPPLDIGDDEPCHLDQLTTRIPCGELAFETQAVFAFFGGTNAKECHHGAARVCGGACSI